MSSENLPKEPRFEPGDVVYINTAEGWLKRTIIKAYPTEWGYHLNTPVRISSGWEIGLSPSAVYEDDNYHYTLAPENRLKQLGDTIELTADTVMKLVNETET